MNKIRVWPPRKLPNVSVSSTGNQSSSDATLLGVEVGGLTVATGREKADEKYLSFGLSSERNSRTIWFNFSVLAKPKCPRIIFFALATERLPSTIRQTLPGIDPSAELTVTWRVVIFNTGLLVLFGV